MYESSCKYCAQNDDLKKLMIYICDLDVSSLYLFREQSNPGRCILAYNNHVNELHDLGDHETALFAKDMKTVGYALQKAFNPQKINYGIYNDTGTHLHCHIVPKYVGGFRFNQTFEMLPVPGKYLLDREYENIIGNIMKYL